MAERYARKRWDRLYARHFPQDTDTTSRWVKEIARSFRCKEHGFYKTVIEYDDPERVADALERTVIALWRTRRRVRELEARLQRSSQ